MQQGVRRILLQAPTGSGKTILTAFMLATAAKKGMGSCFIVHRRELIHQTMTAFESVGLPYGVISSGFEPNNSPTQIASVQTLVRRYHKYSKPSLIIWDEAHHCRATSYEKIMNSQVNAYHVGITATPERLDGKGLRKSFDQLIVGPSVAELIELGYLSSYRMFAPSQPDLSSVKTKMGDYERAAISNIMNKPTVTGDAINEYRKNCPGKRAVVFCTGIAHSKQVAADFQAAGFSSQHVDGETPTKLRDTAVNLFHEGRIQVLCNVDLFGEGFDLPSLECSILLRPTQSLGLYLQQVGRALRPSPGKKEAILLDHAGNCLRHGLPDEIREWSLDGKKGRKKQGDTGPAIKRCPRCYSVQRPGPVCIYCGFVFEVQARDIAYVEGDLQEVDPAMIKRQRKSEQGQAKTLYDLIQLGISRGYKQPQLWASHIIKARQRKEQL